MQALLSVSRTPAVAPPIGAKSSWPLRCQCCVARWEETTTTEEPLVLGGRSAGYGGGVLHPRRHVLACDGVVRLASCSVPDRNPDELHGRHQHGLGALLQRVEDALVQFDAAFVTDQDVKSAVVSN